MRTLALFVLLAMGCHVAGAILLGYEVSQISRPGSVARLRDPSRRGEHRVNDSRPAQWRSQTVQMRSLLVLVLVGCTTWRPVTARRISAGSETLVVTGDEAMLLHVTARDDAGIHGQALRAWTIRTGGHVIDDDGDSPADLARSNGWREHRVVEGSTTLGLDRIEYARARGTSYAAVVALSAVVLVVVVGAVVLASVPRT